MIKKSADYTELYTNNSQYIISAIDMIENDPTILDEPLKINALSALLDVSITQPVGQNYWMISNNNVDLSLTSYIQYIPPGTGGDFLLDDFLTDTLTPAVIVNDYIIPEDFHIMAVSAYYNEYIAHYSLNPTITTGFADIMTHAATNESSFPTKIQYEPFPYQINKNNGYLSNGLLIVNNDLDITLDFNGIAIVNGNVTISKNNLLIDGAIFASGSITAANGIEYGTLRPTFLYADSVITGGGASYADNLYTFSNALVVPNNQIFSGGFFSFTTIIYKPTILFAPITEVLTIDSGMPLNLYVQFTGVSGGGGGAIGEGQLLSTYPRKE